MMAHGWISNLILNACVYTLEAELWSRQHKYSFYEMYDIFNNNQHMENHFELEDQIEALSNKIWRKDGKPIRKKSEKKAS
jgi:hypothetical protein